MNTITVETTVKGNVENIWNYWNNPEHITQWAFASSEWECPYAENNVEEGGRFLTRMSAKDKSASFDVVGTYTLVNPHSKIEYIMDDGRKVSVVFEETEPNVVNITETFDMENENSEELQRNGWQAILDNFKKYVEEQ